MYRTITATAMMPMLTKEITITGKGCDKQYIVNDKNKQRYTVMTTVLAEFTDAH